MYSREYEGETLRFEASGGLINSSLVMQDKETDSYWSIMKGESIAGRFDGTELDELPVSQKILWKDWVSLHPDTLVLSIEGREDIKRNPYDSYMDSDEGFRGAEATDGRLETKRKIFAFRFGGRAYAAPFTSLEGGRVFQVGDTEIFLFRSEESPLYKSTLAFATKEGTFENHDGTWIHTGSGQTFEMESSGFSDGAVGIEHFIGFDTFWYTWSPFHPDTKILQ